MSFTDAANYVLFTNPVSQTLFSSVSGLGKALGIKPKTQQNIVPIKTITNTTMSSLAPLWKLAGSNLYFVRIAGLSGASAVILGAFGAHKKFPETKDVDLKVVFETANRFHFFHSIVLLAMPLARRPMISAPLMITGMTLFCFPCYYRAFSGDPKYNKLAPIGGMCLILAWLSLVL